MATVLHPPSLPLSHPPPLPPSLSPSLPPTLSSLNNHWSSIRDQLQTEAMHLSHISSNLEQRALQPLQVFLLTDLEKRFRNVSEFIPLSLPLPPYNDFSIYSNSNTHTFVSYNGYSPHPGNTDLNPASKMK